MSSMDGEMSSGDESVIRKDDIHGWRQWMTDMDKALTYSRPTLNCKYLHLATTIIQLKMVEAMMISMKIVCDFHSFLHPEGT